MIPLEAIGSVRPAFDGGHAHTFPVSRPALLEPFEANASGDRDVQLRPGACSRSSLDRLAHAVKSWSAGTDMSREFQQRPVGLSAGKTRPAGRASEARGDPSLETPFAWAFCPGRFASRRNDRRHTVLE